jgi:hypothetical protein
MTTSRLAAVTLAALSTACTIVVQAPPADDELEPTTTAAESFPEISESEPEAEDSSTGRADDSTSTGEIEEIGSTSSSDDSGSTSSSTTDEIGSSSTSTGDADTTTEAAEVKQYGEDCESSAECETGLCSAAGTCTIPCTQAVANDCGVQGVTGLCVVVDEGLGCTGDQTFGFDANDDEVLYAGDWAMRALQTTTDADLFLLKLAAGTYLVTATPNVDDDLQIELFDAAAQQVGVFNAGATGEPESALVVQELDGVAFAVVRNTGTTNGTYTIGVVAQ